MKIVYERLRKVILSKIVNDLKNVILLLLRFK